MKRKSNQKNDIIDTNQRIFENMQLFQDEKKEEPEENAEKTEEVTVKESKEEESIQEVENKTEDTPSESEKAEISEKPEEKPHKGNKKIVIFPAIVAVILVFVVTFNLYILPESNYRKAVAALDAGNFEEAYSLFNNYPGYKDGATRLIEAKICEAYEYVKAEKYGEASAVIKELGESEKITEAIYNKGIESAESKEYDAAFFMFNLTRGYKSSDKLIDRICDEDPSIALKTSNVGDVITFGNYEQDNDTSNGKEEIEWIVLAKENKRILIISKYALDCQQYNTNDTIVTWKTCTLRKWCNEDFYNAAFNENEQNRIQTTRVTADANPKYDTNAGSDTNDKVFLLSINEVNDYYTTDESMICKPTEYAKANGAYVNDSAGGCWWWLRSPGYRSDYAARVYSGGAVDRSGINVTYSHGCVRPALWVEIG